MLGLTTVLEEYSHLLRPLYVKEKHPLTVSQFKSLIDSKRPTDPLQGMHTTCSWVLLLIEGDDIVLWNE